MSEVSTDTRFFDVEKDAHDRVKLVLAEVYQALKEKHYVRRPDLYYQP